MVHLKLFNDPIVRGGLKNVSRRSQRRIMAVNSMGLELRKIVVNFVSLELGI